MASVVFNPLMLKACPDLIRDVADATLLKDEDEFSARLSG
jgi:hypothetical protein